MELLDFYDGFDKLLGYLVFEIIFKMCFDFFVGIGDNVYYDFLLCGCV